MNNFWRIFKVAGLLLIVFICSACGTGTVASSDGVMKCSRTGNIDGATSEMKYELYYEGEYLTILHSTEKVISDDANILDTYEEAYKNIYKAYEGLEYYDVEVRRTDVSVTSDVVINYAKIDIDALLDIEGREDNIVAEDGKVKLQTWLDFAEPFGVTCQ
ncbi:MAG: hypothetical protein PUC82_00315 [bacterium]|nr:hypothetical protein [bacterium]